MLKKSFIIILILLFILLPIIYFKFRIYKNDAFKSLLGIYATLTIILTIYNIYKNNDINFANIINIELNSLNLLLQNITNSCNTFFVSNPSMRYYYNELFNDIHNSDDTIRNKDLEGIVSTNILINIDSLINYIDSYKISHGENFQLTIMQTKLNKILTQFMKSKIFIENWNKFKNSFALDWTKTYIQLYFNL